MNGGLGDYRWLNKYVGIPYVFGGRDKSGLDCYGLVKLIYDEQYNIRLKDWQFDDVNLKKINNEIMGEITSGDFETLEQPHDSCFAICVRTRAAHHMGLYFAGGIIHSQEGAGVIYQPQRIFEGKFAKVIYGDWTP